MADAVHIEIVAPEAQVLSETARSVTVPGSEGYFTVMGEHAALLTTLKPGFVIATGEDGTTRTFHVRGGFADVSPGGLSVLADGARSAADFETADIEAEVRRAEEALAGAQSLEDRETAQIELDGWRNLLLEAAHMSIGAGS